MASIHLGRTLLALGVMVGVAWSASARDANAADGTPEAPSPSLRQEWVGLELTPASMALASCCDSQPGHIDTYQAGPGGGIRFGRHRWERTYLIPLEAGLYVTSGNRTIFLHLEVEGGLIVPGTDRRLELGVATGLGILALEYSNKCDGSCDVGGAGWMISLVGRYLFVVRPAVTVGASARLVIPATVPGGEVLGHFVGDGSILLGGLEVGFGHG